MSLKFKNWFYEIFMIGVLLLNLGFGICTSSNYHAIDSSTLVFIFVFFLLLHLGIYGLLKYWTKKNIGLDKIFARMIFLLGFFYFLFIPFCKVPDEGAHFYRIYEISEGHLISKVNENQIGGNELPAEIPSVVAADYSKYSTLFSNFKIHSSGEKTFVGFSSSALYSFLSYIPQAIGVFIARIFSSSLLFQAYMGRFFNFVVCAILLIIAFKMIPCFKRFFFFICLTPLILQQMISLSPDGITIALSFLLLSYVLKLRYDKMKKVEKKDVLALLLITTILSVCKIVYMPLCLFIFLIPKEKFESAKEKYMTIGFMALWVVLVNFVWLFLASKFLIEYNNGVNAYEQVLFILQHPFQYGIIFLRTLNGEFIYYLYDMVGQTIEALSLELSQLYALMTLGIAGYLAYQDHDEKIKIDGVSKLLLGGGLLLVIILIFTSLYVQWTSVKNSIIVGVQGRYFLPLLLLVPCILYNKNRKMYENKKTNLHLFVYLMCYNLYALVTIFMNHIG